MRSLCFSLSIITLPFLLFASDSVGTKKGRISKHEKRAYIDDASYSKMAIEPDIYTNKKKSKRKFSVIYKGFKPELPKKYENLMPKSFYTMNIEGGSGNLPVFFSFRKGLGEKIKDLDPGTLVTIYATCRDKNIRLNPKDRKTQKSIYYLFIDDFDHVDGRKEDFSKFDSSKYNETKFMRLCIQPFKFVDKNVRFDIHLKKISSAIPKEIIKFDKIDPDKHFVFVPKEQLEIPIIVDRENEFCIGPIVNLLPGGCLNVCGVLREAKDPTIDDKSKRGLLYIYLYGINEVCP